MEGFSAHMAAMVDGIRASAAQRRATVQGLHGQTSGALAAFERQRMAAAQSRREAQAAGDRARVAGRRDLAARVRTFRQDQRRHLEHLRRTMAESLRRTRQAVAGAVAARLAECAAERGRREAEQRQMAQDMAERLEAFVNGMRSEVAGLLAEAGRTRHAIGRDGARAREQVLAAIRFRVEEIEARASALLTAFSQERTRMAERLGRALDAGHRDRLHDVHAMLGACRTAREALQEDLQASRRIWAGAGSDHAGRTADQPVQRRDTNPAEPPEAEAAPPPAAEGRKPEERKPSDRWEALSEEQKILRVIRQHPDGISASQIGELVGLHASMVGRIATELAEEGKVTKDESTRHYFPHKGR